VGLFLATTLEIQQYMQMQVLLMMHDIQHAIGDESAGFDDIKNTSCCSC
jgi:hypothetical protein